MFTVQSIVNDLSLLDYNEGIRYLKTSIYDMGEFIHAQAVKFPSHINQRATSAAIKQARQIKNKIEEGQVLSTSDEIWFHQQNGIMSFLIIVDNMREVLRLNYKLAQVKKTKDIVNLLIMLDTDFSLIENLYLAIMSKAFKDAPDFEYVYSLKDATPELAKLWARKEQYKKALHTSFAHKDARAVTRTGYHGRFKRQDGKPITKDQIEEITNGIDQFKKVLGVDIDALLKDKNLVYVHTSGKQVFSKRGAAGLYREASDNVSISLGGREAISYSKKDKESGEELSQPYSTTVVHELAHAYDALSNYGNAYLIRTPDLWQIKFSMNMKTTISSKFRKYLSDDKEVFARMVEQYVTVNTTNDHTLFERVGYWSRDNYLSYIVPAVEHIFKDTAKTETQSQSRIQYSEAACLV